MEQKVWNTHMNTQSQECIPYSTYISWVKIFMIFTNLMPFAKNISTIILTLCTITCFYSIVAKFFNEIVKNSNSWKFRPTKYKRYTVVRTGNLPHTWWPLISSTSSCYIHTWWPLVSSIPQDSSRGILLHTHLMTSCFIYLLLLHVHMYLYLYLLTPKC